MRLQLTGVCVASLALTSVASAEDRAEVSTSLFAEKREGGRGGLTVVHPQALFGVDLGRFVTLDVAYAADAVSGATASVYQVDAVSAATEFSDLRNEGTVAVGIRGKRSRLTLAGTFGMERDYISRQLGGTASIDLPGRNTTVALAYTHGFDQVCNRFNGNAPPIAARALTGADACDKGVFAGEDRPMADDNGDATFWEDLSINTAAATITQNLTPTMNMQVQGWGQIIRGFQSNPYRRVRVGGNTAQENIPRQRNRWAIAARFNRYLPALKAAVHFDGRFYNDNWDIYSGNLELAYSQYVGKSLLVRFYTRVYQQTAANFFKDAFYYETESTAGAYFTGDRELSPVRSGLVGAKLTVITIGEDKPVWGLFDKLQLNLRGEMILLDVLAADSLADNPMGVDGQFIYGTSLVDAVVVQLGLLGNY